MWMDRLSLGSAVTGGSPAGKEAGNGMLLIFMPHSPSTLLTSFLVLVIQLSLRSTVQFTSLLNIMINAAGLSARLPTRGAIPAFRAQRHFSSARPALKEIQDAYILSASRTPTAKVRFYR
jgi:hypothetical protein